MRVVSISSTSSPSCNRTYRLAGSVEFPILLGRRNWLFIGSELAGERAAVVMSLLQSAKLHGHEPWAYLKDMLTRLPTQLNSRIGELLPHRWHRAD